MKRYKQETSILICAYTPDDVMYHHTQTTNDLEISILSTQSSILLRLNNIYENSTHKNEILTPIMLLC